MRFSVDLKFWKSLVEVATRFDPEPTLILEPAGLGFHKVTGDKTTLIWLGVKRPLFREFEVSERLELCFDAEAMRKILRGSSGIVEIQVEDELTISVAGEYGLKEFSLPLLIPDGEPPLKPHELPWGSSCKVDLGFFEEALKDAKRAKSDMITIRSRDEMLEASFRSERMKYTLKALDTLLDESLTEGDEVTLSVELLERCVVSGTQFTTIARFYFGTDIPVKFKFQVPFSGIFEIFLAPMVD